MKPVVTIPTFAVEVDGAALSERLIHSISAIRVQQRLSLPSLCEITFQISEPSNQAAPVSAGTELRLRVNGQNPELFRGDVTAIEYAYDPSGGHIIRVRAYDRLHRLRKSQPLRTHIEVHLEELIRGLVAGHGLEVSSSSKGPGWPRLFQSGQTDLEMIRQAASREGRFFYLSGDQLKIVTLEGEGSPLSLALGHNLHEVRFEVNSDQACRSVAAWAWDPRVAEPRQGTASRPRSGRRVSAQAPPSQVGGENERVLADLVLPDDSHAEARAQAELDVRTAGEVTSEGVADGNTSLLPGRCIEISGVAPELSGQYVVTSVNHVLSTSQGYVSEFSTAPPAPVQEPPQTGGASLGFVTQIDDPENLGRVKVELPSLGGLESEWLEVLSVGAGAGKGLAAIPDVGDRVLVLMTHSEPRQAVVLGGLWGPGGPPDSGVDEGAIRRYSLRTPGGQRVLLDDRGKLIRMENSEGSFLELAPELVHLHAATRLEVEAPGQEVVIRGQSIDFERA